MNRAIAIGVDVGGTTIKSGVVQAGRLVASGEVIETDLSSDSAHTIARIVAQVSHLREAHPEITALGVGLPGLIDPVAGMVRRLPNVPGWENCPLLSLLEKQTGLPVTIDNDARAMAYAEWRHGAGKGLQHLLCMTLGTGVGGGLVLNGAMYAGSLFGAGEIGQTSIDWEGELGNYGNFGALEKYVGNRQIAARALALYLSQGRSIALEEVTPERLARLAEQGDEVAQKIWYDTGTMLGAALASISWLLNLERIVVGGGVAKAGSVLFDPMREAYQARTSPAIHHACSILPAELGTDAGIVGNAMQALEKAGGIAR